MAIYTTSGAPDYAADNAILQGYIATYQAIPVGQRTATQSASLSTDLATLARQQDELTSQIIGPGYGVGVGPVAPGATLAGGTAGSLTSDKGPASSLLAGLSHTTGGLTWSHLALWLAILAGAYIVLDRLAKRPGAPSERRPPERRGKGRR